MTERRVQEIPLTHGVCSSGLGGFDLSGVLCVDIAPYVRWGRLLYRVSIHGAEISSSIVTSHTSLPPSSPEELPYQPLNDVEAPVTSQRVDEPDEAGRNILRRR